MNSFIPFQLACALQIFTNDDSTKISYDIAYVFSLDRLEIPDIAWNMFIFKPLGLVIFTDVKWLQMWNGTEMVPVACAALGLGT